MLFASPDVVVCWDGGDSESTSIGEGLSLILGELGAEITGELGTLESLSTFNLLSEVFEEL